MLLRIALIILLILVVAGLALWLAAREAIGGDVEGDRLERARQSPQWRDGRFQNRLERHDGSMLTILTRFVFGGLEHRKPGDTIPIVRRMAADYSLPPASGLRVSWFGHSTLLLEIDSHRVLIDPVWSETAAPLAIFGSKRYFPPPLPLEELPVVDAVLISHDHYDHLDTPTVKALAARGVRWLVPLGVGAHLVAWGGPRGTSRSWRGGRLWRSALSRSPQRLRDTSPAGASRTWQCDAPDALGTVRPWHAWLDGAD